MMELPKMEKNGVDDTGAEKKEIKHDDYKDKKKSRFVLREFLGKKENVILIILAGILLMIVAWPTEDLNKNTSGGLFPSLTNRNGDSAWQMAGTNEETNIVENSNTRTSIDNHNRYEDTNLLRNDYDLQCGLESRLEGILSKVEGCENISVMITFENQVINNYMSDMQYDYCFSYPKITGVAVVIDGKNNPEIKETVTYIIQALFSLDAHKIRVVNMNYL